MPTRSFVDGAAILGAIEALSAGKPRGATNWAIRSAVEVTTSLLLVPSVTLSPIPESHNSPVGPYGAVLGELAGLVAQRAPDVDVSRATSRTTRRWAMSHPADLDRHLDDLRADESYHRELDVAPKETDEVAIRVAARNVARPGLRTHQPWIDQVTSAAVAVGLGVLTSFFLTGWEAIGVGATAQLAMESTRLTARAAARVSGHEHRLQRLGRMQAGRIGARWQLP